MLRGTTPHGLGRALHDRRLGHPTRRGKWLLVPTDGPTLVLHFGMDGELAWSSHPGPPASEDRVVLQLELSDEILWRARLHPRRPAAGLAREELDRLARALTEVVRVSMRHGRIPDDPEWLESVRGEADPSCPRCGAPIERATVAGRTAYLCPNEQQR